MIAILVNTLSMGIEYHEQVGAQGWRVDYKRNSGYWFKTQSFCFILIFRSLFFYPVIFSPLLAAPCKNACFTFLLA